MGRSAKICRSVSFEKVKKLKKGQVWRYVQPYPLYIRTVRNSGAHEVRVQKKLFSKQPEPSSDQKPESSSKHS
jgi:hypothetical protein